MNQASPENELALKGGQPAVAHPLPPMYPRGMRISTEEEEAVLGVLRSRRLFRCYGPEEGPSAVADLEATFAERVGTPYALAVTSGTWISTPAAVTAVGAVPIIAEADES